MNYTEVLEVAKRAAKAAAEQINKVYASADFETEAKADDSPLTLADKQAHQAIVTELKSTQLPVLSEEGRSIPYSERKSWQQFWMVDPLDGTKEFVKRNGEFTVNIALIENGRSVMGVLLVPVTGKLYWAVKGEGAYLQASAEAEPQRLQVEPQQAGENAKIVASRSHQNDATIAFMADFPQAETLSMGSSLKFMLVAEGLAHLYPRLAPTMEWDTAAAQIIVEEAGGAVVQFENQEQPVVYNKENLLNPHFLCRAQA